MRFDRRNKLEELGFDPEWLQYVYDYWTPQKSGKYEMVITSIDDLSVNPRDGIFVERTRFSNGKDLSLIHHFFEGNAYVLTVVETGSVIGEGIIDGAPFEECSEYETGEWNSAKWQWHDYKFEDIVGFNAKKIVRHLKSIEKDYHKLVKENRDLKSENKILQRKVAELQGYLNCL